MKDTEVIELLRSKLATAVGRHLYGVIGPYSALNSFAKKLRQAKTPDGKSFSKPLSVTRGVLQSIPDDEFRHLVENEAKKPEPTQKHIEKAFELFLRGKLTGKGLVILTDLELLFAYNIELNLLKVLAADADRLLLLLPGHRLGGKVAMFTDQAERSFTLPSNLIADNNLFELK